MPQDKYFRKELVTELKRVERLIKKEPSLEKKLYYFSAAYGITSRTYRYSFSREVLMADFVLHTSYGMLQERLSRMKSGDSTVLIEDEHLNKICKGLKLLAEKFENEESIQEPLELILTTAFSTTGPGNYLREKGSITL